MRPESWNGFEVFIDHKSRNWLDLELNPVLLAQLQFSSTKSQLLLKKMLKRKQLLSRVHQFIYVDFQTFEFKLSWPHEFSYSEKPVSFTHCTSP
jgi:hypothetical protein